MAAHYLKELRTVQSQGPYYIGGYSFGGMVALEMAHQLKAQGHEIGLIVLLDTFPEQLKSTGSLFRTYLTLPLDEQWMHVSRKAKAFPRSVRRRVAMMNLPTALKNIRDACYRAARTYQPKPYDGRIILFRASEKGLSSVNQESAWKSLAPQIEIYEVSGHHGNIVDPPQVRLLADELNACLESAFRKHRDLPEIQSVALASAGESEAQFEVA
jgi:thioesterase domain-containing protein